MNTAINTKKLNAPIPNMISIFLVNVIAMVRIRSSLKLAPRPLVVRPTILFGGYRAPELAAIPKTARIHMKRNTVWGACFLCHKWHFVRFGADNSYFRVRNNCHEPVDLKALHSVSTLS